MQRAQTASPAPPPSVPIGGPQLVVLDTGVIYDDIVYRLRHAGSRGVLVGACRRGAVRLLAADHVYDEMYDSLDGHRRRGVTRQALVDCFERAYLPAVRFVSLPDQSAHERLAAVAASDPDDVPTAALALLVAPALVFAKDRDLVAAGFGRAEDWLWLAFQADQLLDSDGAIVAAVLAAGGAARGAVGAARWLTRDVTVREVALGAALGMAFSLGMPRAAGALTAGVVRGARGLGRGGNEVTAAAVALVGESARRRTTLQAASVEPETPPLPCNRLARTLALAPAGMTVETLAVATAQPLATVEATLAAHRAFVEQNGHWQIGRPRSPRAHQLHGIGPSRGGP